MTRRILIPEPLAYLDPLVRHAIRTFNLPAPDQVILLPREDWGAKWGECHRQGGAVIIRLAPRSKDSQWRLTLAHELAHLGEWQHGRRHRKLTVAIMEAWRAEGL